MLSSHGFTGPLDLFLCLIFRGFRLSCLFCLVRQGPLCDSGRLLIHSPTSELTCGPWTCGLLPLVFFDTVPGKESFKFFFLPFSLLNKGLDLACSFLWLRREMISLIVLAAVSDPTANSYLRGAIHLYVY